MTKSLRNDEAITTNSTFPWAKAKTIYTTEVQNSEVFIKSQREIVQKAKIAGLSVEMIHKLTGLSEKEIQDL